MKPETTGASEPITPNGWAVIGSMIGGLCGYSVRLPDRLFTNLFIIISFGIFGAIVAHEAEYQWLKKLKSERNRSAESRIEVIDSDTLKLLTMDSENLTSKTNPRSRHGWDTSSGIGAAKTKKQELKTEAVEPRVAEETVEQLLKGDESAVTEVAEEVFGDVLEEVFAEVDIEDQEIEPRDFQTGMCSEEEPNDAESGQLFTMARESMEAVSDEQQVDESCEEHVDAVKQAVKDGIQPQIEQSIDVTSAKAVEEALDRIDSTA